MDAVYTRRGFLPEPDPLQRFRAGSGLAVLDEIGRSLPDRLKDPCFRQYASGLKIPACSDSLSLPELRLYYVRLGFLASAYINQVGQNQATILPRNIAVPLASVCRLLNRPPILGYDGYALYNWKRIDPNGPIALGNIDTIQNFVTLYDEHWFILVHVEIEAIAAEIFAAMHNAANAVKDGDRKRLDASLGCIEDALTRQVAVLKRIPEFTDPRVYYKTVRPYVRAFEKVLYEGVDMKPVDHRGDTAAQSSIMPALIAFMKMAQRTSPSMDQLAGNMPAEHRAVLDEIGAMPSVRELASADALKGVLKQVGQFREAHYGSLRQLIDDTVGWQVPETLAA
jgi:indoleamine 2,3-dioxygenase